MTEIDSRNLAVLELIKLSECSKIFTRQWKYRNDFCQNNYGVGWTDNDKCFRALCQVSNDEYILSQIEPEGQTITL